MRKQMAIATATVAVSLLAGCGWVEISPAQSFLAAKRSGAMPTSTIATPQVSQTSYTPISIGTTTGSITAARGDSVYGLARKHGISARALIDANNLHPPYLLKVGQQLAVPMSRNHVVKRGDSLYSISRHYGVDSFSLASANGLTTDYAVQQGQTLMIPASGEVAVASAQSIPAGYAPSPMSEAAPVRPIASPVVSAIPVADRPSSVDVHVSAVSLAPPTAMLLATPMQDVSAVAPAIRPVDVPQQEIPKQLAMTTPPAMALPEPALPVEPVAMPAPPVHTPAPSVVPEPPARTAGFLWPVNGRVVSTFGSKGSGLHNDGINIEAPRGTPIRAAENGVVAYAGNEIRGFGNMLLIKHENGWITAYAHADSLLVKRGDKVKKGDTIARVGSTGTVDKPQLHFEMRKGKQAVDPQTQLKS